MFRVPQLSGTVVGRQERSSSPGMPVLVAAVALVVGVAMLYWQLGLPTSTTATPAAPSTPAAAPAATMSPGVDPPIANDVRRHLELSRQELVHAAEDLVRSEQAWTRVSAQLERHYMEQTRRRADEGTATARAARARLERVLDELHLIADELH
jgi:hypothetical protein